MNWLTSRGAPLVALAALALAGCDEGTGLNVDLPNTTVISTKYTDLEVDAATVSIVPVQTLKTDHYLVGRMADNIAGNIESSAFVNVITGSSKDSLPSRTTMQRPVLDSVAVVIGFDKVYGTTAVPARFDVHNLAAPLDERQAYDSRSPVVLGAPLGRNVSSRLDRTVQVRTEAMGATPAFTTTLPDQTVRLVLHRAVASGAPYGPAPALPSPFSDNFFQVLRTNSNFTQVQLDALLKGLAITPADGYTGSIVSFTRTINARLAFFFHDDAIPLPTPPLRRKWHSYSVFFGPVFSTAGGASPRDPRYFTALGNTFTGTVLSPLTDRTQAVSSASLNGTSYLQEGVGLGTRITLAGRVTLESITGSTNATGVTINRAELRIPLKPFSNLVFSNPSQVFAVEVDANNQLLQRTVNFLPTDRAAQSDGANPLGTTSPAFANLQDATSTQPYYSLLLTSYLQAYLSNKLDGNPNSLVIVPNIRTSTGLSLNRAAVDASRIRLRVYYSLQ